MKSCPLPYCILGVLLYLHPCLQSVGSTTVPHAPSYQTLQKKRPAVKKVIDRFFRDKKDDLELMISNCLLLSEQSERKQLNAELDRLDEAYFYDIILPAIGEHQDILTKKGDKMTPEEDKALVESLFQRRNEKYAPPNKENSHKAPPLTLSKDPKEVAEQEEILHHIRTHSIDICQAINTRGRYQIKNDTVLGDKRWSSAGLLAGALALGAVFSRKKPPKEEESSDTKKPAKKEE